MKKRYFMDLSEVGARLRAARETLELTMEQMRDITGYSKSLISAAENGLKKPSTIYLYAMMDKFNIDINYIFSGRGRMFLEAGQAGEEQKEQDRAESLDLSLVKSDENIRDLFYLMKNVDMVRYAVLSFFLQYRTQHKHVIEELLQEKRRQDGDTAGDAGETAAQRPEGDGETP